MPYTYRVTFYDGDKMFYYYGVRFAKHADPSDLGKTYFTSSNTIKALIEERGIGRFKFEVRRIFESAESAVKWEQKVLRRLRVLHRKDWLNSSIGTSHRASGPKTLEHKQKIGNAHRGKIVTESTREKLKVASSGRVASDNTKEKMSKSRLGRVHISNTETQKTKLVFPEEAEEYIKRGWVKGRLYGIKSGPKHTKEQREKWSNERKGKPNPTQSAKKSGMVNAMDLDGNRHYVTKEEFDARSDLYGIRNSKVAHLA